MHSIKGDNERREGTLTRSGWASVGHATVGQVLGLRISQAGSGEQRQVLGICRVRGSDHKGLSIEAKLKRVLLTLEHFRARTLASSSHTVGSITELRRYSCHSPKPARGLALGPRQLLFAFVLATPGNGR